MFKIDISDRVKLIKMSDGKANILDSIILDNLSREFEKSDDFDGVVITGNDRFFSAGLNLMKLSRSDKNGVIGVIRSLTKALLNMMTFPGPVVAVVNGHAVAGGCLLALSTDYRIGTPGDYKIGVNELAIGLDLPPVAITAIRKSIPKHYLFEFTALGKLYTPEEAVSVGLLNKVVDSDKAMDVAMKKAKILAGSLSPFQRLKERMLKPELERLEREGDFAEQFADQWFKPETQEKIRQVLDRLRK